MRKRRVAEQERSQVQLEHLLFWFDLTKFDELVINSEL